MVLHHAVRYGDRVVTRIAFQNGRVVFLAGKACTSCCQNQCDCPQEVAWGGGSRELTFTVAGVGECIKCMTADIFGYLFREENGTFCEYWAEYDLQSCVGASCRVKVIFEISNFPDCDCADTSDYCDYEPVAWEVVLGSCNVTDVTAGEFC